MRKQRFDIVEEDYVSGSDGGAILEETDEDDEGSEGD
jgi:hypothetical protein